jgi:acetyl-CoA C-acetyltransferase
MPGGAVILAAARTPIGRFQGGLASVPAPRLGAAAIEGALSRARVDPARVTDVLMGNVLQAGLGQAPARQAALAAGLPQSVRAVTVHKVCGSGMQAVLQAVHLIESGMAALVVAGGMENMSRAPFLLPRAREGYRLGHQQVIDSLIADGLWDPYNDLHMGSCAERCASKYGFSRSDQDDYAVTSFERATAAQAAGGFVSEIETVTVAGSAQVASVLREDEGPARVKYDRMRTLRPAFDAEGTITAANASPLSDGAAALVVTSRATADAMGVPPLARLVSFGAHAQDPAWFTTAPIQAAKLALAAAGWSVGDVDLWEVNEAFAVVPMAFIADLGVSPDIVNVHGGAIALGHPIGCSGARIIVTLMSALAARGLHKGVAAICIGGGEALAVCIERT